MIVAYFRVCDARSCFPAPIFCAESAETVASMDEGMIKIALIIFSTIPTAAASFRPLWFAMTVMMIKAIWIQPSWTATGNPTRKICHITFLFGRKSVFFR